MAIETDKFKLGLFVTISFISLCVLFIVFGLFDFVNTKVPVYSLFQESVQGLESGALVKYRGVPIGKVTDITLSTSNNLIRVDMEVNLSKMRSDPAHGHAAETISEPEFYTYMEREIRRGLRARLELNGISGFKYIELDYLDQEVPVKDNYDGKGLNQEGFFYVPSEPSMLSGLRSGITETIAKIASIDYKQISDKLENALNNANSLLADPKLKVMLANSEKLTGELSQTVRSLNAAFTPQRFEELSAKTAAALEQVQELAGKLDKAIEDSKIPDTSASFRNAALSLRDSERAFNNTMAKFNDTLDALSELIKTLDDNPSSLLSGKK
jgi:mammalian cell entry related domain protein